MLAVTLMLQGAKRPWPFSINTTRPVSGH